MSITVLAEKIQKANKNHWCGMCGRKIDKGEKYFIQRCAGDGSVWTNKNHLACNAAYWSWTDDGEEGLTLQELTDGHLPPCWHSINHYGKDWFVPLVGPEPPCTCESR